MATLTLNILTLRTHLNNAYAALQSKGAVIPSAKNATNLYSSIASIPGGGGGGSGGTGTDVLFRDYDGKVLYSYSAAEVASMTELPPLPLTTGLLCQEWNWSLSDLKTYVATYGKCEVGATYTTDDGKTRIKLTIQSPKYATIPIVFSLTTANGVEVDWGDGSSVLTYSSVGQLTISHAYSPASFPATYTITFKVTTGTMSFPSYVMGKSGTASANNPILAWTNMIDSISIGNNVTSIGLYAFSSCYSLASVTIPSSVTSIASYAFLSCYSLASVTIPSSAKSIASYAFSGCYSLASVTIPSSVTSIGNLTFSSCYSLASVTIPSSVTIIVTYAFYYCYSLASVTIPSSVTSILNYAFSGCYSLASVTIPSSVTSIASYAFNYCYSLASVIIPSSVTSIASNAFNYCYSLASVIIPSSVTSIASNAFRNCYGLLTFDFRAYTSIPSLDNVNAFANTPTTREIVVPDNLYNDWIAATNWNSTTNNIVGSIVKASESSLGPLQ